MRRGRTSPRKTSRARRVSPPLPSFLLPARLPLLPAAGSLGVLAAAVLVLSAVLGLGLGALVGCPRLVPRLVEMAPSFEASALVAAP